MSLVDATRFCTSCCLELFSVRRFPIEADALMAQVNSADSSISQLMEEAEQEKAAEAAAAEAAAAQETAEAALSEDVSSE